MFKHDPNKLLNNDFGGAVFGGIGGGLQNAIQTMTSAQVVSNKLAGNITFHVAASPQLTNTAGWFLYKNKYVNSSGSTVQPFLDPASSFVHLSQ